MSKFIQRMDTKCCMKCDTTKAFDEFSVDRRSRDGRLRMCKACDAANRRANAAKIKAARHRRYLANREEILRATSEWQRANRDKRRVIRDRWAKKNREKIRAARKLRPRRPTPLTQSAKAAAKVRVATWRKRNPDKYRAQCARYRAKNKGRLARVERAFRAKTDVKAKRRAYQSARKARHINAGGRGLSPSSVISILDGALGLCAYCGHRRSLTIDHIDPLVRGGLHDEDNAVAACQSCNSSKGPRRLIIWLAMRASTRALVTPQADGAGV